MCFTIEVSFLQCDETYRYDLRWGESDEINMCLNSEVCRLNRLGVCNQRFCGAMNGLKDKTYHLGWENGRYHAFVFDERWVQIISI